MSIIKEICQTFGISQSELSRQSGISRFQISRWANGKPIGKANRKILKYTVIELSKKGEEK